MPAGQNTRNRVRVLHVNGKEVLSQPLVPSEGMIRQTLDLRSFPAGLYFLEFTDGEERTLRKLVVQ